MFLKIRHFVQQSWLLLVTSFCFGILIAATNSVLAPTIEQNKIDKLNRIMSGLVPEAVRFELVGQFEVTTAKGTKTTSKIYTGFSQSGEKICYSFNGRGSGFADKIELVVAVDEDFSQIAGFDCLSSNETPGFGDRIKLLSWRSQFAGAPAAKLKLVKTGDPERIDNEIVAVTGATVSSRAVVNIINNYLMQIKEQLHKKGLTSNGQ